jgi:hypothetical protein
MESVIKKAISDNKLKTIIFIALVLRLVVALISPGATYDINSYQIIGQIFLEGKNPYIVAPGRYPYFPGWMLFEALAVWTNNLIPVVPFNDVVVIPFIIADVIICWLIYLALKKGLGINQDITPLSGALLHALNPAAIYTSAAHGQIDPLAFAFIFAAVLLVTLNYWDWGGIILGVGIAIKTIGLIFGPLFLALRSEGNSSRLRLLIISGLPAGLLSLPYIVWSPRAFFNATLGYDSGALMGWWEALTLLEQILIGGQSVILPEESIVLCVTKAIVILGILFFSGLIIKSDKDLNLFYIVGVTVFWFYSVSAAMAPQYIYWMTPFLAFLPLPTIYRWGIGPIATMAVVARWMAVGNVGPRMVVFGLHGALSIIFWISSLIGLYLAITNNDNVNLFRKMPSADL